MQVTEVIGWVSSLLLIATMLKQVKKQCETRSQSGVSKWLYIGQFAAEIGFVVYSILLRSWVFVFTNTALLVINLVGLVIHLRAKKAKA